MFSVCVEAQGANHLHSPAALSSFLCAACRIIRGRGRRVSTASRLKITQPAPSHRSSLHHRHRSSDELKTLCCCHGFGPAVS